MNDFNDNGWSAFGSNSSNSSYADNSYDFGGGSFIISSIFDQVELPAATINTNNSHIYAPPPPPKPNNEPSGIDAVRPVNDNEIYTANAA